MERNQIERLNQPGENRQNWCTSNRYVMSLFWNHQQSDLTDSEQQMWGRIGLPCLPGYSLPRKDWDICNGSWIVYSRIGMSGGEQLGQTDKLNSKTSKQTKFGQKLLSHIQHHSTVESRTEAGKWDKPLVLKTSWNITSSVDRVCFDWWPDCL